MGFLGPEKKIVDELKAKLDPRGNLETPKNKYSTSIPNVYAAGGEGTNVGQTYHCRQVKPLCSEHARTSYNVFILAHTSRRLK